MKGNQEPMLYTTNATVAALNHVPGFDPLKFLRRTISRKTGEDVMRLDLRYKKLWFRLACPTGRLKLNACASPRRWRFLKPRSTVTVRMPSR